MDCLQRLPLKIPDSYHLCYLLLHFWLWTTFTTPLLGFLFLGWWKRYVHKFQGNMENIESSLFMFRVTWYARVDLRGGRTWCILFLNSSNASMPGITVSYGWVSEVKWQHILDWCFWLDWNRKLSQRKLWCRLLWDQKVLLCLSPSWSQLWLSFHPPQIQSLGLAHLAPECRASIAMADPAAGDETRNEMRKTKVALLSWVKHQRLSYRKLKRLRFNIVAPHPPYLWPLQPRSKNIVLLRTSSCLHLVHGPVVPPLADALVGPSGACSAETLTGTAPG